MSDLTEYRRNMDELQARIARENNSKTLHLIAGHLARAEAQMRKLRLEAADYDPLTAAELRSALAHVSFGHHDLSHLINGQKV